MRAANSHKWKSIEERPEEAESKEAFEHWKQDTAIDKQVTKPIPMVFTAHSICTEIIRKIESISQACIVNELNKLGNKLTTKISEKYSKPLPVITDVKTLTG